MTAPERILVGVLPTNNYSGKCYVTGSFPFPTTPYILATPEALAASPEVAALIAEARREERERCAKECDRIAGNTMDFNQRRAAGMCAAAIRALKETTRD